MLNRQKFTELLDRAYCIDDKDNKIRWAKAMVLNSIAGLDSKDYAPRTVFLRHILGLTDAEVREYGIYPCTAFEILGFDNTDKKKFSDNRLCELTILNILKDVTEENFIEKIAEIQ